MKESNSCLAYKIILPTSAEELILIMSQWGP